MRTSGHTVEARGALNRTHCECARRRLYDMLGPRLLDPLPPEHHVGPRIDIEVGPPLLELVATTTAPCLQVSDSLAIRRRPLP